jgi:hypothetical protein
VVEEPHGHGARTRTRADGALSHRPAHEAVHHIGCTA